MLATANLIIGLGLLALMLTLTFVVCRAAAIGERAQRQALDSLPEFPNTDRLGSRQSPAVGVDHGGSKGLETCRNKPLMRNGKGD